MKDFLHLAESRRSVREFSPRPIAMTAVLDAIRAATYAPSVGTLQPWQFIIITDQETKQALADISVGNEWIANPPVIVAVVMNRQKAVEYYDDEHGPRWAAESVAAATQNLLLQAHDSGLGACWIGSFVQESAHEILGIPDGHELRSLVVLGNPDDVPTAKHTVPLDASIHFNTWGDRRTDQDLMMRNYGEIYQRKKEELKRAAQQEAEKAKEQSAPWREKLAEKAATFQEKIPNPFKKSQDEPPKRS